MVSGGLLFFLFLCSYPGEAAVDELLGFWLGKKVLYGPLLAPMVDSKPAAVW